MAKRKTARTHGAAKFTIVTKQEASLLAAYVQLRARPEFMNAEPSIFITTTPTLL